MIYLYNSLTQQKEAFKPIKPDHVGIYVCGLTVYDYCHLGNARVFTVFDMLTRYLRHKRYQVFYVRNVTDIDDKIIARAHEMQISCQELSQMFFDALISDEKSLKIIPPNVSPRASEYIEAMIAMIKVLVDNGLAYVAANGDVYYEVSKFKAYGEFSRQDLENLRSGARVEISTLKRDPLDFVLWKNAKPNEPFWNSPWGKGRPGWHIECSAMASILLGKQFDIHGGGNDLKFPHHQNEIAQSEGALGCKTVNTWMHVGFLEFNKEKMSKSLGNFFTLREVLAKNHPEVIRFFLLSSHYRSPLNYTLDSLQKAHEALSRLYTTLSLLPRDDNAKTRFIGLSEEYRGRFYDAMNDDLNTPEAFSILFDLAREINRLRMNNQPDAALSMAKLLKEFAAIFGLLEENPEEFLQHGVEAEKAVIEELITARNSARQNKNWAESDRIREQLKRMHIELKDSLSGTTWEKS